MIRKYTHKSHMAVQQAPSPEPEQPIELEQLEARLLAMGLDEVKAFALEKEIDIGNVTTVKGAVGKIMAALSGG